MAEMTTKISYDDIRNAYSRIATEHLSDAQRQAENSRMQKLFGDAKIPPRFQARDFDNFHAANETQARVKLVCEKYAEQFDARAKEGSCLVLCGKPGTGKTHLAAAIANRLLAQGRSAVFRTVLQAVRSVKETYSRHSDTTESEAISHLLAPQLFILDEVGMQFGTDAERMILFEIINGRYEQVKPTILISNQNEREMMAYLGERILDRMYEGGGVVLAFDWESYRRRQPTRAGRCLE